MNGNTFKCWTKKLSVWKKNLSCEEWRIYRDTENGSGQNNWMVRFEDVRFAWTFQNPPGRINFWDYPTFLPRKFC